MKIWYIICFLFLIYSIDLLIDEKYEVSYKLIEPNPTYEPNSTERPKSPECLYLAEKYTINVSINLEQLNMDLYQYFMTLNESVKPQRSTDLNFGNKLLNEIKSGNYFIYRNRFCFKFISFPMRDRYKWLDQSKIKMPFNHILELSRSYTFEDYNKVKIFKKAYPYSNCIQEYSRFNCLNECFK